MHVYTYMQMLITQYTHAGMPTMHAYTLTRTQTNKHAHACTNFVRQKIILTTYDVNNAYPIHIYVCVYTLIYIMRLQWAIRTGE